MAAMPRGAPRPVPDPDGEGYDAMILRENVKRAIADNNSLGGPDLDWSLPTTPKDALFCTDPQIGRAHV